MLWKILINSFGALVRSIKVIFHQLVGLFFLLLGLSVTVESIRAYRQYTADAPSSMVRFYGAVAFALLMLFFAGSSFFRAWSLRRKPGSISGR